MAIVGSIDGKQVEGPLTPVDITALRTPGIHFGPKQYLRRVELLVDNGPPAQSKGQPFIEQGKIGQQPPTVANPNPEVAPSVEVTSKPLPPDILDLSQLRIRFHVTSDDMSSPNAAIIRVYNLSDDTADLVQKEFINVTLNAGYVQGNFGTIFKGTIKQFRRGRESPLDSYLDILAADGDIFHNYTILSETFPAGSTPIQQIEQVCQKYGLPIGYLPPNLAGINPHGFARGKVAFGMLRTFLTGITNRIGCSWSIQSGQLQVIPTDSYMPNEPVKINSFSGMISIPEQTDQGIKVRTLIDPRVQVGQSVYINQTDINKLIQADPNAAPIRFDQRTGIQYNAKISSDGLYRVYVIEYDGDNRGQEWYQDMVCLSIENGKVTDVAKAPS